MEKKFLRGIGQRHLQRKISSQKFLFIRRQLTNGFSGKFFTVFRRYGRENNFQSEIIENCVIFCTDVVSRRLVKTKASQGSFSSSKGKSQLIQRRTGQRQWPECQHVSLRNYEAFRKAQKNRNCLRQRDNLRDSGRCTG